MKVILTGATGFIGSEVLLQCLESTSITSIVVLSRRELPSSMISNPKLKVIVMEDFLSYPESVLQDVKGAEACIWALGKPYMSDMEAARTMSIDYTLTAAKVLDQSFANDNQKTGKFRFIYVSGAAVERDQTKSLWFLQEYRKLRGQVENELIAYSKGNEDSFDIYIARPAMVIPKGIGLKSLLGPVIPSIRVETLAKSLLEIALHGGNQQIVENADMR